MSIGLGKVLERVSKYQPKIFYIITNLKQYSPRFDEECSKLLDLRKKATVQCLQDLRQINGDNQNNVRHEAKRHFRDKKREYLKAKIINLQTTNKNKKNGDVK
jgi:hypothetical protein